MQTSKRGAIDVDFGDILALGALDKLSGIIIRLADQRAQAVNQCLATAVAAQLAEQESGALILAEDSRCWSGSLRSAV